MKTCGQGHKWSPRKYGRCPTCLRIHKREYMKAWKAAHPGYERAWRRRNPANSLWYSAKQRAKMFGIQFTIGVADIEIPTHCPILGIKLGSIWAGKINNSTPSIDRINPVKGYIKGNIAVVSYRGNRLKSDASQKDIEAILKYMKRRRGTRRSG